MKATSRTTSRWEARRAARRERKALSQELSHYRTEADRFEIEAMLERYPDEQTVEIRQMLARQAVQA